MPERNKRQARHLHLTSLSLLAQKKYALGLKHTGSKKNNLVRSEETSGGADASEPLITFDRLTSVMH
jgi:hypothetical protein